MQALCTMLLFEYFHAANPDQMNRLNHARLHADVSTFWGTKTSFVGVSG